jgi:putative zinc finger protein
MNCERVRENLWEYKHNQLGSDLARRVAEHLSSCLPCDDQFQQLKQIETELDCLDEIEPSPFFDQKLDARLEDVAKRHTALRGNLFFWLHDHYALSFVLLLLTTVGAWIGFRYQQAQKLNSMHDVVEVQERYLGSSDASSPVSVSAGPAVTSVPRSASGEAGTAAPSTAEESIPQGDLSVLENYELLQDYDFLKKFDLADPQPQGRQKY